MYPVSSTFREYIKKKTVKYSWHGTIMDKDGTEYELTKHNIVEHTGQITRRCSQEQLSIGTTCVAELSMNLYLDVDRYVLFGGTIELFFTLYEGTTTDDTPITEDVPMGIFTISECNQSNGSLNIIAYDNMTKFDDVHFSPSQHGIQTPYDWLAEMCDACGVELGMTLSEIKALPNGARETGFADVASTISTWKDALGYLATYLGSVAYIGRDGKLYFGRYTANSIDTIPISFRYSSQFSDFRTTYDGIYGTYKGEGVQEYVDNSNTGGLILNIGTNPFLQFTDQTNRLAALQEIIDSWNGVYYVPYAVSMPIVPYFEPLDVLTFTGNQAGEYDMGAITEIVYTLGGKMSIQCTGENPRLTESQDRFTKTVAGLDKEYNNGQEVGTKNFWLLHTENTSALTIPNNVKTQVAEIEFKQSTDVQRMGLMFTSEVSFPTTAKVRVLITIDDSEHYEFDIGEEKMMKGLRPVNRNCGFRITDKGTHVAKVYLTIIEEPLKWSEIG